MLVVVKSDVHSCAREHRTMRFGEFSGIFSRPFTFPFGLNHVFLGCVVYYSSVWLKHLHSEALVDSPVSGCFAIPVGWVLNLSHHWPVWSFTFS